MHYNSQQNSSGIHTKNKVVLLVLVTGAVLFGSIIFFNTVTASPQAGTSDADVVIDSNWYDWGDIPINGGKVTKDFIIKNSGLETLQLRNVKTSCHCTTASVIIEGSESAAFGMGRTSTWVGEVKPGQEAILHVVFDPAFHGPQGTGPINRYISVEINDPSNGKLTFTLTGVVVK